MEEGTAKILLAVITTIVGASGFWAFVISIRDKHDTRNKILLGLAHDRILYLAQQYIARGWITHDEYENLCNYLYQPYAAHGGNGVVKRAMLEVDKLPIKSVKQIIKENENHE